PAVPLVEACAAVVLDRTGITIAQVLFLALGLGVAAARPEVSRDLLGAGCALLGVQIVAVGGFVAVQVAGGFGWTVRGRGRLCASRARPRRQALLGLDRILASSHPARPRALLACIGVHLLGWVVGSLEVYLVLRWLNVEGSIEQALVIDALGTGVKFLGFAIPGALGVLEGGFMLAFAAVGL